MAFEDVVFPKDWKSMSEDEQKQWILTYFTLKSKIPEPWIPQPFPIEFKDLHIKGKTKSGLPVKIGTIKDATFKRLDKNPNLEREFEFWVEKWLITVFHDKKCPATKFVTVSNPQTEKWIAQELSIEVLDKLFIAILKIRHKYGLWHKKKAKSSRKNAILP
ncbi:MAG: hypothetical protein QXL57_07540 [Candidatus Bathyarchaeia archaeon]